MNLVFFLTRIFFLIVISNLHAENWPQWRGPNLNDVSGETNLPLKWGSKDNIAWKLRLPGWSGSTPIIWGDHIFLNVAEGGSLYLWCVDRREPKIEWKRLLGGGDHKEMKQNMSTPSPVTDGKAVWGMTGTGILKGALGNNFHARICFSGHRRIFKLNHHRNAARWTGGGVVKQQRNRDRQYGDTDD